MPENSTELLIPDHLQAYSDAGTYLVGDTLTLDYSDNGCGFNPASRSSRSSCWRARRAPLRSAASISAQILKTPPRRASLP